MYSNVSSLFMKYAGAAATFAALSPLVVPASGALGFYALLAVGLGVFPAVEFFQEWAQGKKIGEIRDYLHKSILPKIAGAEIAVEDLAARYPDAIAEMPEDDARKPFAVLLNLMSRNWDDQAAFAQAFADYQEEWKSSIEESQAWQEQLSNWLLLHQETLVRELDFTRDDISDLSVAVHQLHQELFDELRDLRPQPPLILAEEVYNPEEHQQKLARFVFTHRRVPHIGRATEQKALNDFLMSGTDRCRWWMLTAPGGVGKSRLALETVLYAKSRGWLAGFLKDLGKNDGSYNDWEGWKPDRPTLIVVDYVARRAEETATILKDLIPRSRHFDHPVRVLLLERKHSDQDPWWQDNFASLEDYLYEPPRELTRLNDDQLWTIFSQIFDEFEIAHPDRRTTLKTFKQIDPECRPLLAVLFAETLIDNPQFAQKWNVSDLIKAILNREVQQWKKHRIDEAHVNMLVLATMSGDVSRTEADELAQGGLNLPTRVSFDEEQIHLLTGLGGAHGNDAMVPLEPDLLGELFVLERLAGRFSVQHPNQGIITEETTALLDAAWSRNERKIGDFMARTLSTFPNHQQIEQFESPRESSYWIKAIAAAFGNVINPENQTSTNRWEALLQAHPRRDALAMALILRGATHYNFENFQAASEDYTRVIEMEGAPVLQVALAYSHLGTIHGRLGDQKAAIEHFTRAIEMEGVPVILLVETYSNRSYSHELLGDLQAAIEDYSQVIDLEDASHDQVAQARLNRGDAHGESGDLQAAIKDFTCVIEMEQASLDHVTKAYVDRGVAYFQLGDLQAAIENYSQVIEMEESPLANAVVAYFYRGIARSELGDSQAAIEDFTWVIKSEQGDVDRLSEAYYRRASIQAAMGRREEACRDLKSVMEIAIETENDHVRRYAEQELERLGCECE